MCKNTMDSLEKAFNKRLEEVYKGQVKAVSEFVNLDAVMKFYCEKCGETFYGKPKRMIAKFQYRHHCGYAYCANGSDELLQNATNSSGQIKKDRQSKPLNMELVNFLVKQELTYREVAQELEVNPDLIKAYFISEGLIEPDKKDSKKLAEIFLPVYNYRK